jgi:hypothetical protein
MEARQKPGKQKNNKRVTSIRIKSFSVKCLTQVFLFFPFVVISTGSYAGIVSRMKAGQVAGNFLLSQGNPTHLKSAGNGVVCREYGSIRQSDGTDTGYPAFYVFNTEDPGFLIVSGTDAISPILAYSQNNHFDLSYMSPGLEALLKDYETEINYAVHKNLEPSSEIKEEWADLLYYQPGLKSASLIDSVKPLTTTRWGYGRPYNNFCPADPRASVKNGGHAPAGCAAIAMAQIFKFWNKPVKGIGSNTYASNYGDLSANFGLTTYDWKNMPDVLEDSSPDIQKKAVAALMYHCGISVNMDYNYDYSGSYFICEPEPYSYLNCVKKAFYKYFGYKKSIQHFYGSYTDEGWKQKIIQEIAAGRPVMYAGEDQGAAHASVFEGFDLEGRYYINWGLYGYNNGKYRLNLLELKASETLTYNFIRNAVILTGIEPDFTSGAETSLQSDKVRIWPVPASDELHLELVAHGEGQVEIDILNSLGMKISGFRIEGTQRVIPLDGMNPGIYFVRVNSRDGQITNKFIIR